MTWGRTGGRPSPFIGHGGIGSRLAISDAGDRTVVKESIGRQVLRTAGLLLLGPGGTAFIYQRGGELDWIFPLMALCSAAGWWFGVKYLVQLIGGRRIEIRRADRSIRLFSFLQRVEREIHFSEIDSVGIAASRRHPTEDRRGHVERYTLAVERRDGQRISLCASDRREPLQTIVSLIGARRRDTAESAVPPPSVLPQTTAGEGAEALRNTPGRKRRSCQGCLLLLLLPAALTMLQSRWPPRGVEGPTEPEQARESAAPKREQPPEATTAAPGADLTPTVAPTPALREDGSYVLGVEAEQLERMDETMLWRGLTGEEGERFRIPRDGLLTLVRALIWTESDNGEVVATVYRREGGQSILLGSSRVPAGRFPRYLADHTTHKLTPFPFNPPLAVRAGEVIDVMFAPTVESAVSGIMMKDAYPGAVIAFHNGRPGIPEPVDWDYMARVTIVKGDGRAQPSGSGAATSGSEGSTLIGATGPVSLNGILMRNLGTGGEGQRFRILASGRLTLVEAALWAESGRGEIVATVYRVVGGEPREQRRIAVPAGEFPGYGGIRSTNRLTPFRIDPPLPVAAGETIDVLFHASGMEAVSGILMTDAYPDTEMVFYNGRPGLPDPVAWDFIARATIEGDASPGPAPPALHDSAPDSTRR